MSPSAVKLACDTLVCPFEGYHRRLPDGSCAAYPDPGTGSSPWTIGWGSTLEEDGTPVQPGAVWSRDKADRAMMREVAAKTRGLLALSPGLADEPDARVAALVSFAYNCGLGNYRISTLRKRVNAKDWRGAAQEIVKWNKASGRVMAGLTRRRQAEAMMLA